ncbi:MAG: hypothetical protein AAF596_07770 [Planctomycetota bacterium]
MLGPADFLLGGVLPGVAALLLRAALLRVVGRPVAGRDGIAWPVAVAGGYLVGHLGLATQNGAATQGWAGGLRSAVAALASPTEASQWLPHAALLAAGVALLAGGGWAGAGWASGARATRVTMMLAAALAGVALAIALPTRLLWGSVYLLSYWSSGEAALRIGLIAAVLFGVGWLLTRSVTPATPAPVEPPVKPPVERDAADGSVDEAPMDAPAARDAPAVTLSGALVAPLMAFVALGVAIVLATSGSLSYARLAGVVVASISGALFGGIGRLKPSEISAGVPAAGPVVVVLTGGLILLGTLYAEVTTANAVLLTVALTAAGATRGWAPRPGWLAAAVRVVCCLAPLSIAAGTAAAEFAAATSQAAEENPYSNWKPPE